MANKNTRIITTLCIIHQHPKILLGMKKRGFGRGRWNGFGGKVSAEETIEQAAKRELQEEARITVDSLSKVAVLDFEFKGNPEIIEVNVFKAKSFMGIPTESEEMKPQWFHINEIPFNEMWPDDIHWMPLFLQDKKFKGKFLFGENDVILEKELFEVGEI